MNLAKFFSEWSEVKTKLMAFMSRTPDEGTLAADLATAQGQVTALTAERDAVAAKVTTLSEQVITLNTQIATLTTERDTARTELANAQSLLADPKREAVRAAADLAASQGIPADQLPKGASSAAPAETVESVQAALARATDPKEKGILGRKLKALKAAALN